jgi:hypothetical protein
MKSLKLNLMILGAAILIAGLAAESFAQPGHWRGRRSTNRRIEQGIRSGELTRREVRGIRREQRELRRERRAALSDGHLSREERRDLRRGQRRLNRRIERSKHDGDRRY